MARSFSLAKARDKIVQLFSRRNPVQQILSSEEELSGDEELLDITNTTLNLMDGIDDVCLCSRCRNYANQPANEGSRQRMASNGCLRDSSLGVSSTDDCHSSVGCSGSECQAPKEECALLLLETSEDEQWESLHCHVRQKPPCSSKTAQRQLIASSLICLTFMTAEIIGGYISNSLAIMSDAAHMCTDLVSFLMSIFAVWIAQKSPTKRMSFGFYRAEILGALASIIFIWVLTGILVYSAIRRVQFQDYTIDADVMLIVSGSSVAMNIVMGMVLHGWCSTRGSHNHSHGLSTHHGHESSNINIKAALIHVLGDLLQSIGVLISAYIIKYKPEYKIADPICTFIFSALVTCTTVPIMRDAVIILMEGFPREMNYTSLKSSLQGIKGVRMAHSLHVWSLTLHRYAMAVHLAVDEDADPNVVLAAAQSLVRRKFRIFSSAIQVERYIPSDMLSCDLCRGPS